MNDNDIWKTFGLIRTIQQNLWLYDTDNKLHQYKNIREMMKEFYSYRLKLYYERKQLLLNEFEKEKLILENKKAYIKSVMEGSIVPWSMNRNEQMIKLTEKIKSIRITDQFESEYNYLFEIRIDELTKQKVEELEIQLNKCLEKFNKTNELKPEKCGKMILMIL